MKQNDTVAAPSSYAVKLAQYLHIVATVECPCVRRDSGAAVAHEKLYCKGLSVS